MLGCIATIIVLSDCSNKNTSSESKNISDEEESKLPIYINMEDIMKKEGTEPLSLTFSEITYIPLEFTKNSILKSIDRVAYLNDKFVVSDGLGVFLFDQNGKYIKTVSRLGQGPSDFPTRVNNLVVDPTTNEFYLYSSRKVIKYDKNANYLRNFQINDEINGLYKNGTFTPNNTMIISFVNRVYNYGDTTIVYNAIEIDTVGNILNKFVNYSPRYAESSMMQITSSAIPFLENFNGSIRFMDFSNDTIFTVSGDSMTPYAILDFGKNKTTLILDIDPAASFNKAKNDEAFAKLKGHAIMEVNENDNYFFIVFTEKGIGGITPGSTYNKKTKELKLLYRGFFNDLDGGPYFFPRKCFGDVMIGWKDSDKFKEEVLSMDYNEQKAKHGERFEKVYQLAKSLKEDDNPILIFVK